MELMIFEIRPAARYYTQENGVDVEQSRKDWTIVDEEPFDREDKQMMVKVR